MLQPDKSDMAASINSIKALLNKADDILFNGMRYGYRGEEDRAYDREFMESYIEQAFIKTLVLLEVYGLSRTYDAVQALFSQAREGGFSQSQMGIEDPYLVWSGKLNGYLAAIETSYNVNPDTNVIAKDLISIVRSSLYSITDKKVFKAPPANEKEVHSRIEAVLRCVFPDLKHKPHLTKPIKNFEPDTGLPSVRTLIEYKFISNEKEAKISSDQLLADTRGFFSKDWDHFLYVIYETRRIKQEGKWNQHFEECGVDKNAKIIVLSGEPTKKTTKK